MDIQINAAQVEAQVKALEWDLMEERINEHRLDMTKELPELHPLISIGGSCVCSRGNISAICGEAKSKKTFLASALVASAMAMPSKRIDNFANVDKNMDMRVLWIDTEQGEMHVRRVVERISEMTGAKLGGVIAEPRLTTLLMRELAPMERYNLLVDAIYHNIKVLPFDLIVIDGIADLQRNTNDLEESDALVGALMRLSTQTNTHIICVLHTNPGTDKARGHLGSSLQRKAESVIFVHRVGECSIVEPQFCRNEPFERFAFRISERGIPQLCDLPGEGSMKPNDLIVQLLNTEYAGSIERTTLVNKVAEMLNMSKNTARMRVNRLVDKGLLFFDGYIVSSSQEAAHKHTNTRTNGLCDDVRDVCDVRGADTQTCVCAENSDNDDCPF